jgi:hypothetical protein
VVGLADGGQWRRVDTEPVCLDDERLAAALRTLLDLGPRGVHPTPQKTSVPILGWTSLSFGRPSRRVDLISFEAFDSGAYGDVARCEDVGSEAAAVNQFA